MILYYFPIAQNTVNKTVSVIGLAGVHYKVVDLLSMIQCLLLLPLFVGALRSVIFCNAVLSVLSSFAIVSLRKGEQVALHL